MKQINPTVLKNIKMSDIFICLKGKLIKDKDFEGVNGLKLQKGALYNMQFILGELTIYENASTKVVYKTTAESEVEQLLKTHFHLADSSEEKVDCVINSKVCERPNFKEELRDLCVSTVEVLSVDRYKGQAIIKADIYDIKKIVWFSKEFTKETIRIVKQGIAFHKETILQTEAFVTIDADLAEYKFYH